MSEATTAKRESAGPGTGTLGKAMDVVEIVAASDRPLRFTDILNQSDQPRGTLHRQLSNLVEEGLLSLNRDHSYALGVRLLKFASKAWAGNEFRTVAEPHLRRLHGLTGETVHLAVLQGVDVVYLDKAEGRQAVRMFSQIGNASPAYCTGVGKAALSCLPDLEFRSLLTRINFHRFTAHTICDPAELTAEIEKIRKTGVAFDREEHEPGIRCVAAPICARERNLVAGVSVTGPAYRVSGKMLEGWAELAKDTARRILDDIDFKLGPRT